MILLSDIQNNEMPLFQSVSMPNEVFIAPKEVPVIDYLLNYYPRTETNNHSFVYALFKNKMPSFAYNQPNLIGLSNYMFEGSRCLSLEEQNLVDIAFMKSIKSKPTLSGRK